MTTSEKFSIVKAACNQQKICAVKLVGEPASRIIQPIGVCLTAKRGLIIVCKQTGGYFHGKSVPKTCNFAIENCESIRIVNENFEVPIPALDSDLCTDWLVRV